MYGALVEDLFDAVETEDGAVSLDAWKDAVAGLQDQVQISPAQAEAYFALLDEGQVRQAHRMRSSIGVVERAHCLPNLLNGNISNRTHRPRPRLPDWLCLQSGAFHRACTCIWIQRRGHANLYAKPTWPDCCVRACTDARKLLQLFSNCWAAPTTRP